MQIEIISKDSFTVIGREGSTEMGEGFVARLWQDANGKYPEIAALVKTDDNGMPVGFWGAMSDPAKQFLPWTDGFTKGLYLAGAECRDDTEAPAGWMKWTVPAFRFVRVRCENNHTFEDGLRYLSEHGYTLSGAVQDFTDPKTGINYMCFPIERL